MDDQKHSEHDGGSKKKKKSSLFGDILGGWAATDREAPCGRRRAALQAPPRTSTPAARASPASRVASGAFLRWTITRLLEGASLGRAGRSLPPVPMRFGSRLAEDEPLREHTLAGGYRAGVVAHAGA